MGVRVHPSHAYCSIAIDLNPARNAFAVVLDNFLLKLVVGYRPYKPIGAVGYCALFYSSSIGSTKITVLGDTMVIVAVNLLYYRP